MKLSKYGIIGAVVFYILFINIATGSRIGPSYFFALLMVVFAGYMAGYWLGITVKALKEKKKRKIIEFSKFNFKSDEFKKRMKLHKKMAVWLISIGSYLVLLYLISYFLFPESLPKIVIWGSLLTIPFWSIFYFKIFLPLVLLNSYFYKEGLDTKDLVDKPLRRILFTGVIVLLGIFAYLALKENDITPLVLFIFFLYLGIISYIILKNIERKINKD